MTEQASVFLGALLLGVVLGCLYDFFRITRLAALLPALVILLEDLLFFIISSVILFSFLLRTLDGQVRYFILLGVVLGWAGYYLTLGRVVMAFSSAIIRFVRRVLAIAFTPFRWLMEKLRKLKRHLGKKATKAGEGLKNSLKNHRAMLYNKKQQRRRLRAAQKTQASGGGQVRERTVEAMAKSAAKQKQRNSLDGILKLLTVALLILLAVFLVRTTMSYAAMDQSLREMDRQIEQQKLINKDMELTLRDNETYWERRARELDFAYPGEDIWVFDGSGSH